MYSNFEIWHQVCLWKKAWGYTLKYLWLQYFLLFIWKKSLYNSIQLRSQWSRFTKWKHWHTFLDCFQLRSESKQRALQASGAMRCVTQCWKVSKSNSSSKHHVSHFQQRLPGEVALLPDWHLMQRLWRKVRIFMKKPGTLTTSAVLQFLLIVFSAVGFCVSSSEHV